MCREHDVGLMNHETTWRGPLVHKQSFSAGHKGENVIKNTRASDILRSILLNPEVACVLPGTASVVEAEENAFSGSAPINFGRGPTNEIERSCQRPEKDSLQPMRRV